MFNLADYEPVEVRLEKFIKDYPDFRISTELEVVEASRYIVKAYLYKTSQDSIAWATGYAEETVSTRGVNQTSALENCETSAIGRALANAGYAPKGKRPSREEMSKVAPNHPALKSVRTEIKPAAQEVKEGDVDYWTTPIGANVKTVQAPVTLDSAMATVSAILGTGDAEAARLYSEAFGRDPQFAQFYQSIEAYKASFNKKSDVMVLDPSTDFFKAMRGSGAGSAAPAKK